MSVRWTHTSLPARSLCMLTARRFCVTSTSSTLGPTPTTDEVRDSADHAPTLATRSATTTVALGYWPLGAPKQTSLFVM
jgi:hypothetical protein